MPAGDLPHHRRASTTGLPTVVLGSGDQEASAVNDDIDLSQYAPGGPADTCFRLLACLFERHSYDHAWALLDDNHRRCRAQAWIWNNRHDVDIAGRLEQLVEWLTDGPHPGELIWDEFSEIERRAAVEAWQALYDRQLGVASHPRIIGPNLELMILAPTDGQVLRYDEPVLIEDALTWLVSYDETAGWRIAAWSDRLPIPGLPPNLYPAIESPADPVTCSKCGTDHDGLGMDTIDGKARCSVRRAERLGDPRFIASARSLELSMHDRRDEMLREQGHDPDEARRLGKLPPRPKYDVGRPPT